MCRSFRQLSRRSTDSQSRPVAGRCARVRPECGEAQALQIANPPVTVQLGTREIDVDGTTCSICSPKIRQS
jgi:hypothetical protein